MQTPIERQTDTYAHTIASVWRFLVPLNNRHRGARSATADDDGDEDEGGDGDHHSRNTGSDDSALLRLFESALPHQSSQRGGS